MDNKNKYPDFLGIFMKIKRKAPRKVAVKSKNFFKESFAKGGFTDVSFQEWPKTTNPLARKTMYNKGDLQNSIRSIQETKERVEVGTEIQYAKIHNEGGAITVTPALKAHFWKEYYKHMGNVKLGKRGGILASSAKTNAKAQYCKNIALKKVGSKIKISKRQFIGESETLMRQLNDLFIDAVEKGLKEQ